MVLHSAQYKRHEDEAVDMTSAGNLRPEQISLDPEATSAAGLSLDAMSTSSDHLCEPEGVTASGGRVRFVDSTVRYHMGGGAPAIWSQRSGLERILIVLVTILTLVTSMLLYVVCNSKGGSGGHPQNLLVATTKHQAIKKACLSQECVKVAATMLSDIDASMDPCHDFYKYACGGWERLNPIPDGHSSWSMFEKLWEGNQLVMKNALEENVNETTAAEAEVKAHNYFVSCMDPTGTIESLGGKPLLNLIRTHLGSWRLLQLDPYGDDDDIATQDAAEETNKTENRQKDTFTSKLAILHQDLQSSGFFTWSVGENDHNSSQHVIQIDQGGLTLPTRDYYLKENDTSVTDAFKNVALRLVKLLVKDDTDTGEVLITDDRLAKIKEQIDDVVQFETRLANFTVPAAKRREDSQLYRKLTLSQLNLLADFMDWTTYFANAFIRIDRAVGNDTEVVVYAHDYLASLADLIKEYQVTAKGRRTLDNYMKWHLVKSMRNTMSKPYRDAGKILEKALLGKEGHTERWRFCVSDTDAALGFAVGAMFIRTAFHGESKPVAQEMINRIKDAFEERLHSLSWMDNNTRLAALTKARAISDMIGFPSYIENEAELNRKYEGLEVMVGDYFGNTMASHNFSFLENMRKLDQPVNRTKWSMTPPTVNAYYTPTKNQIVFPAGILQSPFFNLKYPKSLNYGAMGVVMGHELSHAFDDQGREYDENGNMREWWNNATLQQFKSRTECIEEQYSGYHVQAQNVSGAQTLGENIADNGGLQTSFYAYKRWQSEQPPNEREQPPLPALNLTHDQLFFLSFAQVWCSASTPQANKLQIREDPHSPARFRVIGVLSNSREFSNAFNCPINSPMNPKDKCEVW